MHITKKQLARAFREWGMEIASGKREIDPCVNPLIVCERQAETLFEYLKRGKK